MKAVGNAGLSKVQEMKSHIIKSREEQIEFFTFGEGRETFVLAAGNGRPASDLSELAEGVSRHGIRVVTFNYRGIGSSDGPVENLTLHDYANDVWAIVDSLGATQVHLGGKAYGNRVMRTASADQPSRVTSIILYAAGGEVPADSETTALYRRYTDPSVSEEEWLRLHAEINFAPMHADKARLSAERGAYPHLASLQVKAAQSTPVEDFLRGGTAPMLVLTGLDDRVAVPQNALNIAVTRPNTRLVGIPNCGHNMIFEVLDDLVMYTVEHIQRNSKSGL